MLEAVDDEVAGLKGVYAVAAAHQPLQVKSYATWLGGCDAVAQFAGRTEDARAIGPQALRRGNQTKLHRVPIQPRQQLAGVQPAGFHAAGAIGLHVVGKGRDEQQGHMAEQVVKDIGLDHVVEFLGPAYPVRDRKFALCQQCEKGLFGNEPGHADDLPAGGLQQPFADGVELRNAFWRAQLLHRGDELVAGQARQLLQLPCVQAAVGVVVGRRVLGVVLRAGVVAARAAVVAAGRAVACAIRDGGHAHVHAA